MTAIVAPAPATRMSFPLVTENEVASLEKTHILPESPRPRQSPASPIRVNSRPNWAMPPHTNSEDNPTSTPPTSVGTAATATVARTQEPSRVSDAPTPPPHATLMPTDGEPAYTIERPAPVAAVHSRSRQLEDRPLKIMNVEPVPQRDQKRLPSTESSATTSASSVSGMKDVARSGELSPASSLDGGLAGNHPASRPQHHHQPQSASLSAIAHITQQDQINDPQSSSNPDLVGRGSPVNRHLTPNSQGYRRSSLPRPQSSCSVYSDLGPRGQSPGLHSSPSNRVPSVQSRRSPDQRPSSYAEMLNMPYPQPGPAPISLDNAQLRSAVGSNASLLSTQATLEMYRQNVKKTTDMSIQYSFAVFLISTAQEQGLNFDEPTKHRGTPKQGRNSVSPRVDKAGTSPHELVREARTILQRLSNAGYPFAQYYLADGFASGLFSKGKEDYNTAFPLFVLAAKHGHAESAYRTALCYEFGWGCRKDPTKAIQYLRTASSKHHPGAMTRLAKACLSGDLGEKRYKEGIKWMKLAAENADTTYNSAPYQLGCLYETGYGDDIFKDESYAAELFTQAAELGHPDASFRMGDAYEHGKLNCPRDPSLSVHFYTGAAEHGHTAAMMGLCAWYLVGAEPLLERDEEEAYEWARRAADLGYVKAQYAVAYFTEMGIGCRRDILEANVWYVKAADAGEERAKQRLAAIRAAISGGVPMEVGPPRDGKAKKGKKDENCGVM